MLNFHSHKPAQFCDGVSRRDFLRVGALSAGAVGLTLADTLQLQAGTSQKSNDINCIMLFLIGGPSQLDTWDLKPDAPDNVRGPFKPIKTNVPGIEISEHFPLMAKQADRYALLALGASQGGPDPRDRPSDDADRLSRSAAGWSIRITARWYRISRARPRAGCRHSSILPGPIGNTGVSVSHGQSAGYLGAKHEPFFLRGDAAAKGFQIADINAPSGIDPARLKRRKALLDAVDGAAPSLRFDRRHPLARLRPTIRRSVCSSPRRPRRRSTSTRRRASCATATAATRSARAACWPAGWSRTACAS